MYEPPRAYETLVVRTLNVLELLRLRCAADTTVEATEEDDVLMVLNVGEV